MAQGKAQDGITIRSASAADGATIAGIHCESWRDAYAGVLDPAYLAGPIEADRRTIWADRFARPVITQCVLVAQTAEKGVAGFVCLYRDSDALWGSLIDNLHVRPALRSRNIGEKLLRAAAAQLEPDRPFHLWVFEANAGGIRFYQRLGGQVAERAIDDMPAARGAPILRMVWSSPASLLQRD